MTLGVERQIKKTFGCEVKEEGLCYLGVPVTNGKPKLGTFSHILQRLEEKLVSWKATLLSFPARICMINSILATIPSLYFRCMILPKGVLKRIDEITREFLWEGKERIRWVDWETVCKPRDLGGMGIKSAVDINHGLFAKQASKIVEDEEGTETSRMWKRLVQVKYGRDNGGWYIGPASSYAWKCIQKTLEGRMISKRWKVGDGTGIRIWRDRWILEEPLERYPWATDASLINDRRVSDIINGDGTWKITEAERILPEGVVNQLHQVIKRNYRF